MYFLLCVRCEPDVDYMLLLSFINRHVDYFCLHVYDLIAHRFAAVVVGASCKSLSQFRSFFFFFMKIHEMLICSQTGVHKLYLCVFCQANL